MGKELTFDQIDKQSRALGVSALPGLEPGDKIAIMMPNLLQYPIVLFGALRAVPGHCQHQPAVYPAEMRHQFTRFGRTYRHCREFCRQPGADPRRHQYKTVITTSIGEMLGFPKNRSSISWCAASVRWCPNTTSQYSGFSEAIKSRAAFSEGAQQFRDDVILLQYTGGTTGVSKAQC